MILVTGASGLLGTALVSELASSGEKVRAFDFRPSGQMPAGVDFVHGDIRDPSAVRRAAERCDTIFHLAALMHVGRIVPKTVEDVNIGGLKNIMDAAAGSGVRRIVFTSTIEIYGVRPETPSREDSPKNPPPGYAEHKWRSENMLSSFSKKSGVEVAVTRMPLILGPGFYHQKSMLLFFETISRGLPVPLLDGG
ncbi:MAG TPA: NAD-dependent epimerase/dehydratase family protein, partial [bacterium]|nr:NAD-dependent epimerase/dehydratase family protein [bacterium]